MEGTRDARETPLALRYCVIRALLGMGAPAGARLLRLYEGARVSRALRCASSRAIIFAAKWPGKRELHEAERLAAGSKFRSLRLADPMASPRVRIRP